MLKPISLASLILIIITAAAEPIDLHPVPQKLPSFNPQKLQVTGSGCSYTVTVKTSCSSPRYTRDEVSIAFGDAYGNEVSAPRLDDPSMGTFERCAADTFRLRGACGRDTVCYLYLRRRGRDGWAPQWVSVSSNGGGSPVTFYYGEPIPDGVWYGFNQCRTAGGITGGYPISRV